VWVCALVHGGMGEVRVCVRITCLISIVCDIEFAATTRSTTTTTLVR